MSTRLLAALALMLTALQGQNTPVVETLTAEKQASTPGGATFTVPAGWSIRTEASFVVVQPPEGDSRIVFFDSGSRDAESAVKAAWEAYRPDMKRPVRFNTKQPGRNGWDDGHAFAYETSPNERLVLHAAALRSGDRWTVTILDGTQSTFEKRGAPIGLIIQSLRPKGHQRESFAGRKAGALNTERIAQMKSFVETSMKTLGIPGASMALIDGGKVVFEGGFGVRELGKQTPVDADTLFLAASNTKGMTTLLLAQLVDEKRLRWNQPVKEVYPGFKLGDAKTTDQVLVKHLVCACTGLPRQDMEWIFEFEKATAASSLELLGTMQPTSQFGEVYQYSNLMASAAGYVGAYLHNPKKELGAGYDEAMQKRIFGPLGMRSTTFDFAKAQKGNHARPHADDIDGKPAVAGMSFNYAIIPHRPAGGVWASAHDLIRYVQLELHRGKLPDGKTLVSDENLLARREPQVMSGEDRTYGMGLSVDKAWGIPIVHHGGSLSGYKSDIMLLPDHGIGAVLLTNSDNGGMLLRPFMRRLVEVVFDGKPEAAEDVAARAANSKAVRAKLRQRLVTPPDSEAVGKLAARYTSTALGALSVRQQNGSTIFDFGEWNSSVASRKNDDGTTSFLTINPGVVGFEFVMGERGGKRTLVLRDAQHEYVFTEAS